MSSEGCLNCGQPWDGVRCVCGWTAADEPEHQRVTTRLNWATFDREAIARRVRESILARRKQSGRSA
jgi:hypothetical protein